MCQPLASALLAAKGRASADLPICRLQQQRLAADLPSPWDGACGNVHACCRWRMITQHAAACCTATDSMKLLACSRGEKCLLTFFVKVSNAIQSRCIQCAGCCTYVIDGAGAAHGRVGGRQHANGVVWDPVTSSTSKQRRQARACACKAGNSWAADSSWSSGVPAGRRAQRRRHVMQLPAPGHPPVCTSFSPFCGWPPTLRDPLSVQAIQNP